MRPAWSRDGTQVAYYSTRSGKPAIYVRAANGIGVERRLWEGGAAVAATDWTPDSKSLVLEDRSAATGRTRLMLLPLDGKEPAILLELPNASAYFGQCFLGRAMDCLPVRRIRQERDLHFVFSQAGGETADFGRGRQRSRTGGATERLSIMSPRTEN